MSQVIIVSNRLPVSVSKDNGNLNFYPSVGGLATGLASYVNDKRNMWIGWPGIASDKLTSADKQNIVNELAKHNCTPVFLTQKQIDDFYNGYSNMVLWPLFHNLPRQDSNKAARQRWWRAYRSVNLQFTEAVLNQSQSGGHIWVHDYQLLLVPEMLRAERRDITTGFFLHIPFPAPQSFQRLPEDKKLLGGMLGADLVGFHTASYVENFLAACQDVGLGVLDKDKILIGDRVVRVADFPMGIDYEKYASAGKSKAVQAAIRRYRRRYKGRKVIVAVDRMDPSKGLVERLKAYQLLLERNPSLHGKVIFSMVAAPSRTDIAAYQRLAQRLDKLVAEINGTYGTDQWQPVDYMNVTQPFEEVTALFQVADVAFIAPLRDGMNLAAKEFVASTHKNAVLILSETAGAAEELQEALLVNPKRPEALVEALQQSLNVRRRDFRRRLKRMRQRLRTNTVHTWAKEFVEALQQPTTHVKIRTHGLSPKLSGRLLEDFKAAKRRLLLLDYDGSLVPFTNDYEAAKPPKSLISLLQQLSANKQNDVVVISGRSAKDLGDWFGDLPLSLVAEHGAAVKKAGNKTWKTLDKDSSAWKQLLQPALERYARQAPKARVEVKPHSLVWHYRAVPPYHAQKYAVTIKRVFHPILRRHGLELLQGNKVLEVKNPRISKGSAAQAWLQQDYDFILGLGDDATDEELFMALPAQAYSIKVGPGRSAARFRLKTHQDILQLLKKLSKTA